MKQSKRSMVSVQLTLDPDELVESLFQCLSFDEIHDFVVKLDKACQDWGVTERLHKYFESEMKKCPDDESEMA